MSKLRSYVELFLNYYQLDFHIFSAIQNTVTVDLAQITEIADAFLSPLNKCLEVT
jgi:hypothetical protein